MRKIDMTNVALIGFSCNSGLGELNRQIASYCQAVTKWLVKPHSSWTLAPPQNVPHLVSDTCNWDFLRDADVLLFCESQIYSNSIRDAKAKGKRVVCVPMIEWMPSIKLSHKNWTQYIDLFICPTKQCYDILRREGYPCVHFPWPCETRRLPVRHVSRCERFLYIHGNGGYMGRKGGTAIYRAKRLWPEFPVTVVGPNLRPEDWPKDTELRDAGTDNLKLYEHGDVLVYPACIDGVGLQPYEAMATGMPVVVTQGDPWDDQPAIQRLRSFVQTMPIGPQRFMDWHAVCPEDLVDKCKRLHGADISMYSEQARTWAQAHSWEHRAQTFTDLVISGVAT